MSDFEAKIRFRLGLCPRPCWGVLQRFPRPPSWILRGPTSKGGEGRDREERKGEGTGEMERGQGRWGVEGEGRGRKGKGPPSKKPGYGPVYACLQTTVLSNLLNLVNHFCRAQLW